MRRILVERARRKKRQRQKQRGPWIPQELDEIPLTLPEIREDLLALDEALTKLAAIDRTAVELIHLRYFTGLTLVEAAAALKLAPRTAERLWAYARAWLHRELRDSRGE